MTLLILLLMPACQAPGTSSEPAWPSGADLAVELEPAIELPGPLDPGASWSLPELLERARLVAPKSAVARAAVERAAAAVSEAEAALGLRLDFTAGATTTNNPALAFMGELNADELDLSGGLGSTPWTAHSQLGLHAGALLWDGGRSRARIVAAQLGLAARAQLTEARALEVEGQVVGLYLGLRESRALEAAARGRLRAVDAALEAARTRVEAGSALASETTSLEARRAALEESLQVVLSLRRQQLGSLALSLGGSASQTLEVDLNASNLGTDGVDWRSFFGTEQGLEQLTDAALAERPELAAARGAVEAQRKALEAAELASGPTLSASGDAWMDGGTPVFAVDRGSASLGAQLSWNLVDGGLRESREAGARAELRASQAQLAQAVDAIELQVLEAYRQRQLAELRLQSASTGRDSAAQALAELSSGYDAGQVPLERWLGAEAAAGEAEAHVAQARVRLQLSDAQLQLALGRSLLTAPRDLD